MSSGSALPQSLPHADDAWWRRAVVYQVYPRSFADSNGDGIGDLRGVIDHLDHFVHLGVDVIWLSPIYQSPQDDNGYDISDYQSVDPMFGNLADFDELIERAHDVGIRIVMDVVINHTSDEHPWFIESASSRASARRDWYWWRPGSIAENGESAPPNNWGSFFSGPAWTRHAETDEYYLHLFSRKQPDLNWENADVREAIYEMLRWWVSRGVDGFRLDVINLISKDPHLPQGAVPEGRIFGEGGPHFTHGPRLTEYLGELRERVFGDRASDYLLVGETPGITVDQARDLTQHGPLSMVFQFEHVSSQQATGGKWFEQDLDIPMLKQCFERWQLGLHGRGWNSLYWNNHDQPRSVSRFGSSGAFHVASATALATVLHLQQGTPFIYQGEEIGMTNMPFHSIEQLRDIESLNHYREQLEQGADPGAVLASIRAKGRDNARTPMQWNSGERAGFTDGVPWIDINPNHVEINVEDQRGAPDSVLEYYRRLIAMRHREPVVSEGDFSLIVASHPDVFAFTRRTDSDGLLVIANLSGAPTPLDEPLREALRETTETLLSNGPLTSESPVLDPWRAAVMRVS